MAKVESHQGEKKTKLVRDQKVELDFVQEQLDLSKLNKQMRSVYEPKWE